MTCRHVVCTVKRKLSTLKTTSVSNGTRHLAIGEQKNSASAETAGDADDIDFSVDDA